MNHRITRGMALLAGAWLLAASSMAQTATSTSSAQSDATTDMSVNCPPTASIAPGKATHHAAKHGSRMHTAQVSRTEMQLRRKLDQCGDKTDRSARAECVRDAWEATYPARSTRTASLDRKTPC